MTRTEALRYLAEKGRPYLQETASFETAQILSHVIGGADPYLPFEAEKQMTEEELARAERILERRMEGQPLQYLLGEWEFWGIPLSVGPGVLIPRSDTETVVEWLVSSIKRKKNKVRNPVVIDLCTGSGAIALAAKKEYPYARVIGVDVSQEALRYARANGERNALSVEWKQGDVFGPLDLPQADYLVSNPPYLTKEEMSEISKEVQKEPIIALSGGEDGLVFYRALLERAREILKPGGMLFFEIGSPQAAILSTWMWEEGYHDIYLKKDLQGNHRCLYGTKKE